MIKTDNILIKLLQWIPIFGIFCLFKATESEGRKIKFYNLIWILAPIVFSILNKLFLQ